MKENVVLRIIFSQKKIFSNLLAKPIKRVIHMEFIALKFSLLSVIEMYT